LNKYLFKLWSGFAKQTLDLTSVGSSKVLTKVGNLFCEITVYIIL